MTRTLVLTVDRDNDLGLKTAIRGPVVGRKQVLTAALKLGIADPEESDTNAILGALNQHDNLAEANSEGDEVEVAILTCLLYTSPSPRDMRRSRMPSSA